ncbi:MAG: AMP-binding protein [Limisphaerales bacterium]
MGCFGKSGGRHRVRPERLAELFAVFERLDQGEVIALLPSDRKIRVSQQGCPEGDKPCLGCCSSGSTGRPKLVWWPWTALKRSVSRAPKWEKLRWASPFRPWSFAGVQVALQAWISNSEAVSLRNHWSENWATLRRRRVDALSCTPTFIDLMLQNEPSAFSSWQPKQITLGGEALSPRLGQRLRQRFPATRFTMIYASTELGVLAKAHRLDGCYEVAQLAARFPDWRLKEGVLEVRRGTRWYSSGDRVEVVGNLFRVTGRRNGVANVAGTKVDLTQVAALAERVRGVRRATALAIANPVVGEVVGLRFAVETGFEFEGVRETLDSFLRRRIKKEAWPRIWEEDSVEPEASGKRPVRDSRLYRTSYSVAPGQGTGPTGSCRPRALTRRNF